MSPKNKAHYESEKEVIHLILTGIGNEIYSTIDACKTTQEMWEAIERLQQGESLNIQDVKTNLFWEFGKFTSHDGETIESYYIRKCILEGPYTLSTVVVPAVPTTENSPAVPEHTTEAVKRLQQGESLNIQMSRQTYSGSLENSPITMEKQ
nr:hypothetical protein [Tanacetum cinerariifolium]